MSTAPAVDTAVAVAVPAGAPGQAALTLSELVTWRFLALSFVADLTSAGQADDIWVRVLYRDGTLLAGEVPGSGQAVGTQVTYSLAPDLNPCDSITSAFLNLTSDTFTPIVMTAGCQVLIEARAVTSGTLDASALITNALLWVSDESGAGLADLEPVFIPVNIQDVTLAVEAGVGALEGLF